MLSANDTARLRVVEENVQFALLAEEVPCGFLDGREVGQVKLVENCLLSGLFFQSGDSLVGLLLAAGGEVYLRIVLQECLGRSRSDRGTYVSPPVLANVTVRYLANKP